MKGIEIRWLITRDIDRVLEIEAGSFDQPWGYQDFRKALRQKHIIGMVAEHGDEVVGYMVYELHTHSLRLVNIAVAPEWRRNGIARLMVRRLASKLVSHNRNKIIVTVSDKNLSGHLWLRACGFQATKVDRNLFGDGEDGYCFRYVDPARQRPVTCAG